MKIIHFSIQNYPQILELDCVCFIYPYSHYQQNDSASIVILVFYVNFLQPNRNLKNISKLILSHLSF